MEGDACTSPSIYIFFFDLRKNEKTLKIALDKGKKI